MGKGKFTQRFKQHVVKQITERDCWVSGVLKHLGISTHSRQGWMKRYPDLTEPVAKDEQVAESRWLKLELARVTGGRYLLNMEEACRMRISQEGRREPATGSRTRPNK